jgi:hypothetical protein
VADRSILSLTAELDWISSITSGDGTKDSHLRAPDAPGTWLDQWFENEVARVVMAATEAYAAMRYRDALK